MLGAPLSALMAKYSRYADGIQAVRVAANLFEAPVEFVLLDNDRALIVAAANGTVLGPRALLPAEQAQRASGQPERTVDSTSMPVHLPGDSQARAALSLATRLDEGDLEQLAELAASLTASLATSEVKKRADRSFDEAVLTGLRDTVVVLDGNMVISWSNDGVVTSLGWAPEEFVGRPITELIHPEDLPYALQRAGSLVGGHRTTRMNLRLANAFGGWVPVSITAFDHTTDPIIGGLVISIRNDEREIENERALVESQRVSTSILKNLHEAVIATDEAGSITVLNDAARALFSIDPATPVGLLSIDDIQLLDMHNAPLVPGAHPLRPDPIFVDSELRVATQRGLRHVTVNRSKVSLDHERFGIIVTFVDRTQARSDAHELRNRERHDQLTGLANRSYLAERLQSLAVEEPGTEVAACYVGIDNFKNVNDIHGHRVGDAVLQASAARLRREIGETDILTRPGGDEFLVIILNPESERTTIDLAERVRSVFHRPFDVESVRLHLTASVGVAFQDQGKIDDERLLQHADIALYAAKDRGRDRVEIFDQDLATVVLHEQAQRNMVREALDNNRVEMHFQPIVNSEGETIGAEALARCLDENGSVIAPAGFMEAIDGTNLMVRLDREGFNQTCQLASILTQNPATENMWVASNFSATTLAQRDFADVVLATMNRNGVNPSSICIEVTETAAFEPGEASLNALTGLHEAGLRIALDDFGTGYSSLSHLRDLPLTTVKIDRSFTSELHKHGAERAIASAVKDIAESLGFGVVAEGVETAEDREAVEAIGVESMQGWYFAKALPRAELLSGLDIDLT